MTKKEALYVAVLRLKLEYSWGMVHSKFRQRYEFKEPFTIGQKYDCSGALGRKLCNEASKILNISVD